MFVYDYTSVNDAISLTVSRTWIGLNDVEEEGVFVWTSSLKRAEPTFWASGEPGDVGFREDCAILIGSDFEWHDYNCETPKFPFVCEKE